MKHQFIRGNDESIAHLNAQKKKHKHKSFAQTIVFLSRLESSLKKADKKLYQKLIFNLN